MACLTPIYTNCIVFTAGFTARLKDLGYQAGTFEDLLIEIIEKGGPNTASQIASLQAAVSAIDTKSLPANARTFGLSTGSVDAAQISDRSVAYAQKGKEFTYDLTALKAGLPTGFTFLGASVSVVGADGKRSSVRGPMAKLQVSSLPAQAQIVANVQTANGLLSLEKSLYISADAESTATLTVRDLNDAPADLKQHEFNELIAAEVVALKQRM